MRPPSTICRYPADQCDATEYCTGSSADCPANSYVPNGWACNDGNACTQTDTCVSGTCTGSQVSCGDSNACTADSCDPSIGCRYALVPDGTPCGDGVFCNGVEACQSGVCQQVFPTCNDGNPCTTDSCFESERSCLYVSVPNGTPCSGGTCQGGICKI